MKPEEYKKITSISFPNTAEQPDRMVYRVVSGCSFECVMEAGEMAGIAWIAVFKDGEKVAQIKQSVCDIYFKE